MYVVLLLVLLSAFIFKSLKNIGKNQGIFFILTLFPLLLLVGHYFSISNVLSNIVLVVFIASITFYPFTFVIKKLKDRKLNLLVYLTLLIEWDWIITWTYLNRFSLEELNPLLDVNSLFFFSIQKLMPLAIFFLLYLVSRDNKKLSQVLEIILVVVAIAYALLFLWQMYVVSLFTSYILYLLPISIGFIIYFVYKILRNKFSFKR